MLLLRCRNECVDCFSVGMIFSMWFCVKAFVYTKKGPGRNVCKVE